VETLTIRCPGHGTTLFGLELQTKLFPVMEKFVRDVNTTLREWTPFFQGGSMDFECALTTWIKEVRENLDADWALFQFWTTMTPERQTKLMEFAEGFAAQNKLELAIR
jgi:hypothetical protein